MDWDFLIQAKTANDDNVPHGLPAGSEVWLGWTPEAGGWYQWNKARSWAKRFSSASEGLAAARQCPGPWFYKPDPTSITAVPVPKLESAAEEIARLRAENAELRRRLGI